jgi:hypothetical protein
MFDVPFSFVEATEKRVVRGLIDAVIRRQDGSIEVVLLQTGTPVARHARMLALCMRAAQQMFAGAPVNGRTLYCTS